MDDSLIWQDSPIEKHIEITINAIENVVRKDNLNVSFVVEHNDNILGESDLVAIESNVYEPPSTYDVNFTVKLVVILSDQSSVDSIVSTPVLIKALASGNEKEIKSGTPDTQTKKKSKFTSKSPTSTLNIIGMCNLDLFPIILGEKSYTEKLVLETPQFSFDDTAVSWQNLPFLNVTATQDDVPLFSSSETINFLNIVVESIYNIPAHFTIDLEYKAGTIVFVDNEVPENVIFENGTWMKYRDVENTKRWNTLSKLQNRARLSKYKLDCDFMNIKNVFKKEFDITKKVCEDKPRIEWNLMNRFAIRKLGTQTMENHITKYKYWPFQFMLTQRVRETNKAKSKDNLSSKIHLYQCYVDLSELLFPGNRSTRVVAQLYTYNSGDITEKAGQEKNIFVLDVHPKETKDREKKGKTSKYTQSLQSETEQFVSTPLIGENGEPTLIIIEFELYEPLIACRAAEDFSYLMKEIMPIKRKKSFYPYSGHVAEEQYEHCIQKLAEIITESYRDFCEQNKEKDSISSQAEEEDQPKYCYDAKQVKSARKDELTCFTQFLYKTGVYVSVRNTLKSKVTLLLDQKFKIDSNTLDCKITQDFIASTYTYLVERMHIAINKIVEGRLVSDFPEINPKALYYYADEAYELGLYEDAEHYYKTVITSNKSDTEAWTKYAVFLLKIGDLERTEECCREAIVLDGKNKIALIVYAAVLFEKRNYREAEIFFRAITNFYPRCVKCWTILNLFYRRTEYYPGVDIAIRTAEKCMKDEYDNSAILEEEPFAWSMIHCPRNSVYAITATFLLKLHLCELAGIALAEEMSTAGRSTHVLYYMAVEHYLSDKYEDALSHLKEARCIYGMDYSISSLMGHCYYKMGDFKKAQECYEFGSTVFNRPDNLHLVEIRMGLRYIVEENYQRSKKVFLSACKSSPTSQSWFGVGISFYHLNEFAEAEAALSEANRINNRDPEIWGYLCLLNLSLRRYDEFAQCYREMIRNNLKNRKLWLVITKSMEACGYEPPTLTFASEKPSEEIEKE